MEELIRELHSPSNQSSSERVQEIQRQIQLFQQEKSGWETGFDLLNSADQVLRFYGALTLTVKINGDWEKDGMNEDDHARSVLLERLLSLYAYLVNVSDASIVLLKLCSTISALFIKDDTWQFVVRQLGASVLDGTHVSLEHAADPITFRERVYFMKFPQLRGLLYFASTLVEDVARQDSGTSRSASLARRLEANSEDVWLAIKVCLDICGATLSQDSVSSQASLGRMRDVEAVECTKITLSMMVPWLEHVPSESEDLAHDVASIESIAHACIASVFAFFSHEALRDIVLQTLTSIAETSYRVFRKSGFKNIASITTSDQAATWVAELRQGEFSSEPTRYVDFLVMLIKSEDLSSPEYLENQVTQSILLTLKELMACEGTAVIEDEVCQQVLECLAEVVDQSNEWAGIVSANIDMKAFIHEVFLAAIAKAELPMSEMDGGVWDLDDRARFQDFRVDVAEFLLFAFVSLGHPLIESLTLKAISIEVEISWPAFEASLFCLLTFMDALNHDLEQFDPLIRAILTSSPWSMLMTHPENCPRKARQTAIRFVAAQTGYLRRNLAFLVPCLDFLFRSLHVSDSSQAAARAIQNLCESERDVLTEALPQFMSSLHSLVRLESNVRNKVYRAIASIIQALPREAEKIKPLNDLLDNVSMISRTAPREEMDTSTVDVVLEVLQALAAIGTGLKRPVDGIIDLEASPSVSEERDVWKSTEGQQMQQNALSLCNYLLTAAGEQLDGEIVEAACDFMASGFAEDEPSPFKFSSAINVGFLISQIRVDSLNIDAVMGCATKLLASTKMDIDHSLLIRLVDPVFSTYRVLVAQHHQTSTLPPSDFPASSMQFLSSLPPRWWSLLLSTQEAQETLTAAFDLGLILLSMPDTLPRRVAASFFSTTFELAGHGSSLTEYASTQLTMVLTSYAASIVAAMLYLIGGECAKSEIEAVTEMLRKMVSKQTPTTRKLLKDAMNEQARVLSVAAYKSTTLQQRLRFIAQAEGLRGGRKTIELVKDFWIVTRGDVVGYVF